MDNMIVDWNNFKCNCIYLSLKERDKCCDPNNHKKVCSIRDCILWKELNKRKKLMSDKLERVVNKWDDRHKWNLHADEKLALMEDVMDAIVSGLEDFAICPTCHTLLEENKDCTCHKSLKMGMSLLWRNQPCGNCGSEGPFSSDRMCMACFENGI